MTSEQTLSRMLHFIESIGIKVCECVLPDDTFLPGLTITHGSLCVDRTRLRYPGDLLHEAGHLAVLTTQQRANANGRFEPNGGDEMAAIAWSYAAAVHLQVPLEILFHDEGYKGGAASLRENFAAGRYIGVPLLAWLGLTQDPARMPPGEGVYPQMKRWLVDVLPVYEA